MKIIKEINCGKYIIYIYRNKMEKKIWNDGKTYWYNNRLLHNHQGTAYNTKHKRYFYLGGFRYFPNEFAEVTNHEICLICNDFCKQECF